MNRQIMEIDMLPSIIKKNTPYLNDLHQLKDNNGGTYKLYPKLRQRAYAWYYVHNGGNKSDAYRRAYYSVFDPISNKLLPRKDIKPGVCGVGGAGAYKNTLIQQMISLIRTNHETYIKGTIGTSLLDQLVVQATYDPSMFINPNGSPVFNSWDQIPEKYRCCVQGIETKRFGKNGDYSEIVIKLVDRKAARDQLLKIAPGLLEPDQLTLIHKTVDKDGNETGVDYSKYSDGELRGLVKRSKV